MPFHDLAAKWLKDYIENDRYEIMMKAHQDHNYVFVNKLGKPLTNRGVEDIVDRVVKIMIQLRRFIHIRFVILCNSFIGTGS